MHNACPKSQKKEHAMIASKNKYNAKKYSKTIINTVKILNRLGAKTTAKIITAYLSKDER
jgi:hypothetical protein